MSAHNNDTAPAPDTVGARSDSASTPTQLARRVALYLWERDTAEATNAALQDLVADARSQGDAVDLRLVEYRANAGRFPYRRLRHVFALAERKRIDVLYIETINALGISPATILKAARRLTAAGVRIVSIEEPWFDLGAPMAGWLAEAEQHRVQLSVAALAEKRVRGERTGQVPYGFCLADDRVTLVPDPNEQEIIQRCVALRAQRLGYRRVARALSELGFQSRAGTRITHTQVARMLGERSR